MLVRENGHCGTRGVELSGKHQHVPVLVLVHIRKKLENIECTLIELITREAELRERLDEKESPSWATPATSF